MLECSPIDDIAMTLRKMRLNIIRLFAVEDPNTEPSRLLPNRVERIHVAANAADPESGIDHAVARSIGDLGYPFQNIPGNETLSTWICKETQEDNSCAILKIVDSSEQILQPKPRQVNE